MSAWMRFLCTLLAAAVVGGLSAGIVSAQIEPSPVTVNACVADQTGALRIPAEGETCRANETPLSWTTGLLGHQIVSEDRLFGPDTTFSSGGLSVRCPTGKKVMGGGGVALVRHPRTGETTEGSVDEVDIENDYPSSADRWAMFYEYERSSGSAVGVRVFATCAS